MQLVIFEYLTVFAMYLFMIIYLASLIRKQLDVSLWDTTIKEKVGNVVIIQLKDITFT